MKTQHLKCLIAYLLLNVCFTQNALAGSMGETSSFSGLVFGVGGGYVNSNLNKWTDVAMISSFPSTSEYYRENNVENAFAPIANLSYFKPMHEVKGLVDVESGWYMGLKGFYEYFGLQHPNIAWNGTFQNGTYQQAEFHTEVVQDFFLTLNAGYQCFEHWLVYLGIGPSITTFKNELRGELLSSTALNFQYQETSTYKTLWGVAAQTGFNFLMPHGFMLDLSYLLVITPKGGLKSTDFITETDGIYSRFSQQVNLMTQGLNITINKFF